MTALALVRDPEDLRTALTPLRRRLLELLREPASATQLAEAVGLTRQKVNYHLRALERAGLAVLVAERPRRGCVERLLAASADAFVVDPDVLGPVAGIDTQDRMAAVHLVNAAAAVVRDVARQQEAADREGTRLLTFTVEAEVRFGAPADIERFAARLGELVAQAAGEFEAPAGRAYRVVAGGHPAPTGEETA
jgi:DNA-binding transcriptional ArsR family regulator